MSFAELGLAPELISALDEAGIQTPTSVQAQAIPLALQGNDLMVSSQTGSGKTAAFMLPALNRMAKHTGNGGVGVQMLVLAPTRELAMQVADAAQVYGAKLPGLRVTTVVGGVPYGAQIKALSRRVDVLVATPGRLIDHLKTGRVKLNSVHTLVLDEADRMLDMGFIEDIEAIIERTPADRQTLLFSATLDGTVAKLAEKMMREPQRVEIAGRHDKHANITQTLLYADDFSHKLRLLDHLLRDANLEQAIIFTATKRGADDLADKLSGEGFSAVALHGDMNQRQRTRTLSQLQRGQARVLVATDVAARGIDVQGISHAINFDLPLQAEDYVHRIGRTGRAGRDGLAYTLALHGERHKVRRIESYISQTIASETIAGLEPQRAARPERPRSGKPGGGKFQHDKRAGGFDRGPRKFEERREFSGERREHNGEQRDFAKREFGDRPQRDFSDRPQRSFGDKPGFKPRREFGDRPAFGDRAPREGGFGQRREFGDRPQRNFGDKPAFGDRPQRAFGDKPAFDKRREFGDRPQRSFGDKPAGFKPRRESGDRPAFGDRAPREGGAGQRREFGDRPQRTFGDKPAFGDRPQRAFGDKPAFGQRREFGDRPQRDFGDRTQRSGFGDKPRSGKPFEKRAGAPKRFERRD